MRACQEDQGYARRGRAVWRARRVPEARLLARRQGRVRCRQHPVLGLTWVRAHAQRGGGWLLALSRLSLAGLEFVGATLSPEDTSLGERKAGCSVSLPTSWCMGRRFCDVMARWTSVFEESRSKWTGLGWTSPSGARRLMASCPGKAADRAGAGCRMLSSASPRALTTRVTAFAACRRGGRPALRGCVRRSPASTSRAPRSSLTRSPPMRSHSGRSASRLTTDSTRARRLQISSVPLYPLEFI